MQALGFPTASITVWHVPGALRVTGRREGAAYSQNFSVPSWVVPAAIIGGTGNLVIFAPEVGVPLALACAHSFIGMGAFH